MHCIAGCIFPGRRHSDHSKNDGRMAVRSARTASPFVAGSQLVRLLVHFPLSRIYIHILQDSRYTGTTFAWLWLQVRLWGGTPRDKASDEYLGKYWTSITF